MGAFFRSLREQPAPLTRGQKILFALFAIGIAVTRLPAVSLTLHDWDETLFAFAVSEYDVKAHHPHPPGYPLFIVAAKFARLFTSTDFQALQAVATAASMLLFPAAFLLARELRFRPSFAFGAAAMTAFLPPVWYYGGTGFSDVPALTLILFAAALLLRGGRSARAYVAGVLLTAMACGIRPHLLLVAAPPALLGALALRRMKTAAASWLAAAAVVALAYVGAAYFSTNFPQGYLEELRHIRNHISRADSFRNPDRTPLPGLAPRVFLFPFGGRMRIAVIALAVIALADALVRRRPNVAILLAMFLPMAVFTWLMLDVTALSRYAIAYLTLHAFLAVAGAEAVARLVPSRARVPLFVVLAGFVTWSLIKWTWPALRFARTEPSPAVAAFQWIRTHVPKPGPRVYVHNQLGYHARYFIGDYDYRVVFDETVLQPEDFAAGNVFVFEGDGKEQTDPRMFTRKRLQLWELARPRFFEVGILPMWKIIRWGDGWHLPESNGRHRWRWMRREAEITLGPAIYGRGELRLKLHAPVDAMPRPPVITILWNGAVLDRRTAPPDGNFDLRYVVPSQRDRANELRLMTDQTIRPEGDGRELGLSLEEISWSEPTAGALQ